MNKYFLYARKSTDVEDKQVLSIEAQITELRAYARNESTFYYGIFKFKGEMYQGSHEPLNRLVPGLNP